jgi:FAD/FMN-containing dehydrogenase
MQPQNGETIPLADWSGFTVYGGTAEVPAPRTEGEVAALVRQCQAQRQKLRVVGLRTSWSALWHCPDAMMTTSHLNAIKEINVQDRTITCEAGVPLSAVHEALWQKGLTLDTAPGVDWVTVGGAVSTGSHGSGPASMSSSVTKARVVTAAGETLEIREGDDRLDALRLSLGLLGVLTTVTLRVAEAFEVSVKRARIPARDWERFLSEGEMSYLLWFPHTDSAVFMRVDVLRGGPRRGTPSAKGLPEPLLDLLARREGPAPDLEKYRHAVAELANLIPATFPARNRYLLDVFYRDFEAVGPAHEMLMSFRSEPIAGGEWAVPVARFGAAFEELQAEAAKGDLWLPVVWLKKVKGETAWLRAADGDCVQCGIYHNVIEGTPSHVKGMVTRVERLMARHGGRPHLGKLIYLPPADLKRLYPNWEKFDALRRQMDPQGMFWSPAVEARFGGAP